MDTLEEHQAHDNEAEKRILSDIEKYGFHIVTIPGDGYSPSFSYTIGLFKSYGYPELICFGLSQALSQSMFGTAKKLLDNTPAPNLTAGHPDFLEGYDVMFLTVDRRRYPDYFGYGRWFYEGWYFPALQLVWPDKQAAFPWEEGFNPDWRFKQPLLDRDHDFKFREEHNVAVFTTRQVLEGQPILRVSHEADGDWQFLCGTTAALADLQIVGLEELVKRDATLNEVYELNYGWYALREAVGEKWQTEEYKAEEGNKPEGVAETME